MWTPPDCGNLSEMVALQHEYYLELRNAGFTRHEALHIMMNQSTCACDGDNQ